MTGPPSYNQFSKQKKLPIHLMFWQLGYLQQEKMQDPWLSVPASQQVWLFLLSLTSSGLNITFNPWE
jgi:hypothetical protein